MKKLSFLLAMLLVLSSMFALPVFAATSYTYSGATNASNTFAAYTASGTTTTSGLTSDYNVAAPQKASNDVAYHIYGTTTVDDFNIYKFAFNKVLKNETDFNVKNNYSYSIDAYFPSTTDATARSEILVAAGVDKAAPNVVFMVGTFDTTRTFNTSTIVVDGLEKDKWYNFTIDFTFDGKNLVRNVYVNGVAISEYYKYSNSTGWSKNTTMPLTTSLSSTLTSWYMVARPSLKFVTGEKHNFYFDNVIYRASAFTPDAPATISNAEAGVVTVDAGTTAEQVAALAIGASSVEVYRADSSALGFTQVTGEVAKNDIIKLVTANGSYSYYTLDVKEVVVVNPFVVGALTAPASNPAAGSTVSASLALSGDKADKNVTLILCVYKGITLIDIKTASITKDAEVTGNLTTDSITVPSGAGNYTAKAFVWDTLTGMQWVPTN